MFVHPSGSSVSINFLVNNEKIAMGGPVLTASVSAAAFLGGDTQIRYGVTRKVLQVDWRSFF